MAVQKVRALVMLALGSPGVRMCQSMMQYIPLAVAKSTRLLTWVVKEVGLVR